MGIFAAVKPYLPISGLAVLIIIFGGATIFVKSGSIQVPSRAAPSLAPTTNNSSYVEPSITNTPTTTSIPNTPTPTISPTLTPPLTPSPAPSPQPTVPVISQSVGTVYSGTIQFSGQAPLNSRIVVFQKTTGSSNYQLAIDNLVPYNSSTWMWDSGGAGGSHDLIAILKQKQTDGSDLDLASSNVISSTATTSGVFILSYGTKLLAPSANISVACTTLDSGTQIWQASVSFQTVSGAASYWFAVGTTDGGIELTNFTQNAEDAANQVITLPFQNGTTYYARYGYASVPGVSVGDPQLSPLSSSVQLKCS